MSYLELGLVVVVGLLTVVVVALVRTQAVTARRLALVERRVLRAQRRDDMLTQSGGSPGGRTIETASLGGDNLVDVRGLTVQGSSTEYPLERPGQPTLVAFLSTTCSICLSLWLKLRDEGLDGMPAVVVTKDPAVEELEIARDLAQDGTLPVVMSSEAWEDYEVPGSPYFIVVDGDPGVILAEGEASSWEAVRSLAAGR